MHFNDEYENVLGMRVAVVNRSLVVSRVAEWVTGAGCSRYICVANVHMCMESFDDAAFRRVVNNADLTVPDGFPLAYVQRLLGRHDAQQVRGEDLTADLCAFAESSAIRIGLFGGSEPILARLKSALQTRFPRLDIAYAESPPFRQITAEEDAAHVAAIKDSGAKILFVGLGCPKQEVWMAAHKDRLPVVMVGVGAAFDFISGSKPSAPRWLQKVGLEWLFRLSCEPKRLWRRYLKHNPRFVWQFAKHLMGRNRLAGVR